MEDPAAVGGRGGGGDDNNDEDPNNNNNNPHHHNNNPNPNPNPAQRPRGIKLTRGKQVIPIRLIRNEAARLSTFSKRRSGIYKKANELVVQCGVDIGIAGITPAGRTFSFAHPSDEVFQRFLREEEERYAQQQQQGSPHQQQEGTHQQQQQPQYQQQQGLEQLAQWQEGPHQQQQWQEGPHQQQQQPQGGQQQTLDVAGTIVEAHRTVRVNFLNMRHNQLQEQHAVETARHESLMPIHRAFNNDDYAPPQGWWELWTPDTPDEESDRISQDIVNIMTEANEILRRNPGTDRNSTMPLPLQPQQAPPPGLLLGYNNNNNEAAGPSNAPPGPGSGPSPAAQLQAAEMMMKMMDDDEDDDDDDDMTTLYADFFGEGGPSQGPF